ncbi:MAG: hypothetical protein IJW82_06830 [Clostridia bacterium]|nr:hypothetical protein [Clostridia bacterium]
MCFFKRKNSEKLMRENKNQLMNNARFAESLTSYSGLDMAVVNAIGEISDKLKYLNPSGRPEVSALDKKIENKLADLKIEITTNRINETKVNLLIKEITNLVADRDYESKKK